MSHEAELERREREIVTACLMSDQQAPYNVPVFVDFGRPIDAARMVDAVRMTAQACPQLCRSFSRSGTRLFAVAAEPVVEHLELSAADIPRAIAERRIPVLGSVLFRAAVLTVRDTGTTRLYVNAHHAVVDGVSLTLILRAVMDAYLTGEPTTFAETAAPETSIRDVPRLQDVSGQLAMVDIDASAPFIAALDGMRRPGVGPVAVRRTMRAPEGTGFSGSLGAVVPALSVWADTRAVLVSTALVGRNTTNRALIGNFVRLQPLVFDADSWPRVDALELRSDLDALAVRLAIQAGQLQDSNPVGLNDRLGATAAVFDYGTPSLVPDRLHDELAAHLIEDDSYVDPKYGLHISVDQTGDAQRLTLIADGIPAERLEQLAWIYSQQLRYGPLRKGRPESPRHSTKLAASA